jgi:L-ribulose-5-phosphate 4-epimerase
MREVPPSMDQSSALGGGELVLVDEYEGAVNNLSAARSAVASLGDADLALLAGHGVLVIGCSARAVHQRAVALEQRCTRAWQIRAAGGSLMSPMPASVLDTMARSDGDKFIGFWEAMARQELRAEPDLLGS